MIVFHLGVIQLHPAHVRALSVVGSKEYAGLCLRNVAIQATCMHSGRLLI